MLWEKLTRIKPKKKWIIRLLEFATVKELRDICKDRGFRGYSGKNKSDLIKTIIANLTQSELEELLNILSVTNRKIKDFRKMWNLIPGEIQVSLYGKEIHIKERSKEIENLLLDMEGPIPEKKKEFIPKEYGLKDVRYRRIYNGWEAFYYDKETKDEFEIKFTHGRKPLSLKVFVIDYEANEDCDKSHWEHLGNYASIKQAVKKIYSELWRPFPEKEKHLTPIKCRDITKWI